MFKGYENCHYSVTVVVRFTFIHSTVQRTDAKFWQVTVRFLQNNDTR